MDTPGWQSLASLADASTRSDLDLDPTRTRLPPRPPTFQYPRLVILKQHSLSQEPLEEGGRTQQLHTVVKHSPFIITLGLDYTSATSTGSAVSSVVDISHLVIEAKLLYAAEGEKVPVILTLLFFVFVAFVVANTLPRKLILYAWCHLSTKPA